MTNDHDAWWAREREIGRSRGRRAGAAVLGLLVLMVTVVTIWATVVAGIGHSLSGEGEDPAPLGTAVLAVLAVLAVVAAGALVLAGTARAVRVWTRVLAGVPAAFALVLAGLFGYAFSGAAEPAPERPAASGASPEAVLTAGAAALNWERRDEFCLLRAERARGRRCADAGVLVDAGFYPLRAEPVVFDGTERAFVRFYHLPNFGPPPYAARLVREDGEWQLLDVPGVPDACVEKARDPWGCPVRVVGE